MFFVPIPRAIAKERGLKTYQSSKPCNEGLLAPRSVLGGGVCLCFKHTDKSSKHKREAYALNPEKYVLKDPIKISQRKLRDRERYVKNKVDILAKKKEQRLEDPEKYNERNRNYRAENRDSEIQRQRDYYSNCKEELLLKASLKRKEDPEKFSNRYKKYYQKNKPSIFANEAKRRATLLSSKEISWSELDQFVNTEAFSLCILREHTTGFKWQVDHMIPLKAKVVCGLHVWNNFQCIPKIVNLTKKNRLIYTNPHEWLYDIPKFFKIVYQQEITT